MVYLDKKICKVVHLSLPIPTLHPPIHQLSRPSLRRRSSTNSHPSLSSITQPNTNTHSPIIHQQPPPPPSSVYPPATHPSVSSFVHPLLIHLPIRLSVTELCQLSTPRRISLSIHSPACLCIRPSIHTQTHTHTISKIISHPYSVAQKHYKKIIE